MAFQDGNCELTQIKCVTCVLFVPMGEDGSDGEDGVVLWPTTMTK